MNKMLPSRDLTNLKIDPRFRNIQNPIKVSK
jgi:hypothetical protein